MKTLNHYVYMTLERTKLLWIYYDQTTEVHVNAFVPLRSELENSDWNRRTSIENTQKMWLEFEFLRYVYALVGL